ncbi:MAG: putative lipopolysaccharide heptosyltransferase III [Nitrospirae bacterium]|nr:putative lipopolysaccharide heptosyltransferase III [Nitrospirota bacterium]
MIPPNDPAIRPAIQKILVIKLKHHGDVLLAVPSLRALREQYPRAEVTVLVNAGTEEMVERHPLVDAVLAFPRQALGFPFWRRLREEFAFARLIRRSGFDLVIDLSGGDRSALFALLSKARCRMGYDPMGRGFFGKRLLFTHLGIPRVTGEHMVLQNLDLLRQFGIGTSDLRVTLPPTEEEEQWLAERLRDAGVGETEPVAQVHPTSRWLFKCWRDEGMARVIDRIQRDGGVRVVVTSGPDGRERDRVGRILSLVGTAPVDLTGKTTIRQLMAVARRAALFFGVDSAPMHIAAAAGTPVVALFGPSGEALWGPWGERHRVLTKPYPCRPCGRDGCEGSKRSLCLEAITAEEVWEAVREMLGAVLPASVRPACR